MKKYIVVSIVSVFMNNFMSASDPGSIAARERLTAPAPTVNFELHYTDETGLSKWTIDEPSEYKSSSSGAAAVTARATSSSADSSGNYVLGAEIISDHFKK